jgi:hypothetical protein
MAILNVAALNVRDAIPNGGDLIIATRPRQIHNDPELQDGD